MKTKIVRPAEIKAADFPKLESPFVRKMINGAYVVTPEITKGCEWVFEDPAVLCTEKLDGTDVSIIIENGAVVQIWNRLNAVPFFNKGKMHLVEAVMNSFEKGYCDLPDGQHFGEAIGPKLNGNPYKIESHLWMPFNTWVREHLVYKSYHNYPKTFQNISDWFRKPINEGGIFSLLMRRRGIEAKPEGVVFHHPSTGRMAKLRLDMFEWFTGRRHNDGYSPPPEG
jgi:hypothetical protein